MAEFRPRTLNALLLLARSQSFDCLHSGVVELANELVRVKVCLKGVGWVNRQEQPSGILASIGKYDLRTSRVEIEEVGHTGRGAVRSEPSSRRKREGVRPVTVHPRPSARMAEGWMHATTTYSQTWPEIATQTPSSLEVCLSSSSRLMNGLDDSSSSSSEGAFVRPGVSSDEAASSWIGFCCLTRK
jgi:hypothetical protein